MEQRLLGGVLPDVAVSGGAASCGAVPGGAAGRRSAVLHCCGGRGA
jgi:hypothetical protein